MVLDAAGGAFLQRLKDLLLPTLPRAQRRLVGAREGRAATCLRAIYFHSCNRQGIYSRSKVVVASARNESRSPLRGLEGRLAFSPPVTETS